MLHGTAVKDRRVPLKPILAYFVRSRGGVFLEVPRVMRAVEVGDQTRRGDNEAALRFAGLGRGRGRRIIFVALAVLCFGKRRKLGRGNVNNISWKRVRFSEREHIEIGFGLLLIQVRLCDVDHTLG